MTLSDLKSDMDIAMANHEAVVADKLSKTIGHKLLLSDVNLRVDINRSIGITGHNGSGKSTLLRAITGLMKPTTGTVSIFGKVLGKDAEFAPDTGALIDIPQFLPRYSGFRNLELLAMIRQIIGKQEIRSALTSVGLDPDDKRPFRVYSTGMRQRLGIAQAIMEHPRLLILDEPTRGIDTEGHEQIYHLLRTLRQSGVTLILASHSSTELHQLCDEIYVMENGRLRNTVPNQS